MKARTTSYRLQYRRFGLEVKLRRFRIAKAQRSKSRRQYVLNLSLRGVRQIVFEIRLRHQVGRPKKSVNYNFQLFTHYAQVAGCLLLIIGGIAGTAFWGSQLLTSKSLQPAKAFALPASKPTIAPKTLPASQPLHISIPSVNIDADIVPVGLDTHGAIALPAPESWQVGWYSGSPTPGQLGPAIIAGHVDSTSNISVFWRLRYVQAGDIVTITRADGNTATFTITNLDQYDQANFPTDTVYHNLPYAGLKLITCGGTFDEQTHHYSENTVVSAQLK